MTIFFLIKGNIGSMFSSFGVLKQTVVKACVEAVAAVTAASPEGDSISPSCVEESLLLLVVRRE